MIHLLSSSAFIICNKILAKKLGLKATILLSDLISKEEYFITNGQLDSEGYFFNTQSNIEDDTTLTPYQQRNALKTLKKYFLIDTKRKGIPAKQYFKINEEQVMKFLNNKETSSLPSINKNKEIIINNNITLSPRQSKFEKTVNSMNFPTSLCKEFIFYWTELNKSKTKMRFELEKTFDVNRRMLRWEKNTKKWNRLPNSMTKKVSKIDQQLDEFEKAKKLL
tara:strand:+ start:2370 stop:3035 length:666 start_codon:yes stop_codon:yes gene_type:complete